MGDQFAHSSTAIYYDQGMPFVEIRHSIYQECSFSKHVHDTFSLGAVLAGQGNVFIRNRSYEIGQNDIVVIHPDEIHSCNPRVGSNWEYLMAHINMDWMKKVLPELASIISMPGQLNPVFKNHVILRSFVMCYNCLKGIASGRNEESMIVNLLGLLLRVYNNKKSDAEIGKFTPSCINEVKSYLSQNIDRKVSLQKLSRVVGISPYYLLRVFSQHVGITPHAYLMQIRINLARTLIRQGFPLKEIALETGFFDQSHFTKVFKRSVGVTPKAYLDAYQC